MNVALDLDNTLLDTQESAKRAISLQFGIPENELINTGMYHQCWTHADPQTAARIRMDHSFWEREDVLFNSLPIEGAVASVHRLAAAGILASYVTRRSEISRDLTLRSLSIHGFPFAPIRFVGHTNEKLSYADCKTNACRMDGATLLIDDNPGEIERAIEGGLDVIMVDASIGRPDRLRIVEKHPTTRFVPHIVAAVNLIL